MKYFDISFPDEDQSWSLEVPWEVNGQPVDVWSFIQGRDCQRDPLPLIRVDHPGLRREFNLSVGVEVPIVAPRVGEILELIAPNDIQRIPVKLEDGSPWEIINAVNALDAIDHQNSKIIYHKGRPDQETLEQPGIQSVYHLTLQESRCIGHRIFRLSGWTSVLVFSEEVLAALVEAGICDGYSATLISTAEADHQQRR